MTLRDQSVTLFYNLVNANKAQYYVSQNQRNPNDIIVIDGKALYIIYTCYSNRHQFIESIHSYAYTLKWPLIWSLFYLMPFYCSDSKVSGFELISWMGHMITWLATKIANLGHC